MDAQARTMLAGGDGDGRRMGCCAEPTTLTSSHHPILIVPFFILCGLSSFLSKGDYKLLSQ